MNRLDDMRTPQAPPPGGLRPGAMGGREAHTVRTVTAAGLAVNLVLFAAKLTAGILGSSRAVAADAVHSLSDMTTDIAVLVGVRYWSRPADPGHPYGHRRIETLVTTLIGLLLGAVAVGIAWDAVATLRTKHFSNPGWIAFGAAVVSIVTKEALYRWHLRAARRVRSRALVANAWHHRSDALSSIPAALAVAGSRLLPNWAILDHVGAVVVAILILHAAWRVAWPSLRELMDAGVSRRDQDAIRRIVMATPGVRGVHAIRTRYAGAGVHLDLHLLVDESITVRQGHDISERVQCRLLAEGPDLVDTVVHIEPGGVGPPPGA